VSLIGVRRAFEEGGYERTVSALEPFRGRRRAA
jgi:hypothetical protein